MTAKPTPVTFASFQAGVARLVESFAHNLAEHKKPSYVEAQFLPSPPSAGIANIAPPHRKQTRIKIESGAQSSMRTRGGVGYSSAAN